MLIAFIEHWDSVFSEPLILLFIRRNGSLLIDGRLNNLSTATVRDLRFVAVNGGSLKVASATKSAVFGTVHQMISLLVYFIAAVALRMRSSVRAGIRTF